MLLVLAVIGYGEGGVGSDDGVFKISFFYKLFWVLSGGVSTLGIWALEVELLVFGCFCLWGSLYLLDCSDSTGFSFYAVLFAGLVEAVGFWCVVDVLRCCYVCVFGAVEDDVQGVPPFLTTLMGLWAFQSMIDSGVGDSFLLEFSFSDFMWAWVFLVLAIIADGCWLLVVVSMVFLEASFCLTWC
ncbi:unnamed protein product [Amaranthus hypochondriacus]